MDKDNDKETIVNTSEDERSTKNKKSKKDKKDKKSSNILINLTN